MQSSVYTVISYMILILAYTYQLLVMNYILLQNYTYILKQNDAQLRISFSWRSYCLPDGIICLLVGINDTNFVVFKGSFLKFLPIILALVWWCFKLSLEECIKFTILGLKIIVVHGLLSFHHLKKFGQSLRQHLQQQQ